MSILIDYNYANQITSRLENFKWQRPMLGNSRCPMCGDSSKKKSKRRFYIYQDTKRGSNHLSVDCKNCGYSNPFSRFLEEFDSFIYQQYRMEIFQEMGYTKKRLTKKEPQSTSTVIETVIPVSAALLPGCIRICDLPSDHPASMYIRGRKIPEEHFVRLWYSSNFAQSLEGFSAMENLQIPADQRIVIPFFDEWGNLTVVQGRSMEDNPSLRYVTIKKQDSSKKVYGLERVNKSRTVMVVEGPFDSLFLPNCVATADADLLGAEFSDVFVPDNQYRNSQICDRIQGLIDAGKRVVLFPSHIIWKDINDIVLKGGLTKHELYSLIADNIYQGLSASLEFAKLRKDRKKPP